MTLEMITIMQKEHTILFQRLLRRDEFIDNVLKVYKHSRSQENAVRLLEALTSFFMKHLSPSLFFDYPLIQKAPVVQMDVRQQMQA